MYTFHPSDYSYVDSEIAFTATIILENIFKLVQFIPN